MKSSVGAVRSTKFAVSNMFLGNITHSCQWYPGHKKVFLIVPVNSTLVRKDRVSPISCCD